MLAAMLRAFFGVSLLSISIATRELQQEAQNVVDNVTPIQKVIVLLKDLEARVEKEGAKEAAQYDRFSCFCKNQAKFKQDAIDKSTEKIEVLEADITDIEAAITELNTDIATLTKDIAKLEKEIKEATEKRDKEHEEYLVKAKDAQEAIDACIEAVEALKASKEKMSDAKLDLAQLKTAAVTMKAMPSPGAMRQAMMLVRQAQNFAESQNGVLSKPAAAYQYQSNDIIATIEDLEVTFKEDKKELDKEEFDAMDAFEKKVLGFTNEKDFKTKEKKQKEAIVEARTEDKAEAEKSKADEEADKKSDEDFVKSLKESCEQKATDWDERSKTRSEEVAALAEARATLENGAVEQYNVNKKLVGFVAEKATVKKASIAKAPVVTSEAAQAKQHTTKAAASFLQIRNVGSAQAAEAAAVKSVLRHLDSTASKLRSPVLAAISFKVALQEDHFVKVRALIKDLVQTLKDQAKAEASTKSFCDKEMTKAMIQRDKAALAVEEQKAIISKNTAIAKEKAEEIKALKVEIAELHKALLEAEGLREQEKANNEQTVKEAEEGAKAVASALTILKGFYKLIQVNYKPPDSDRYGKTVDDYAPEVFEGEYKGAAGEGKGIIGILEVIESDFKRTKEETEKAEAQAVKDYEKFKTKTNEDITTKEESKSDAITAEEDAEAAIVTAKDDLFDAETSSDNAAAELEKLSPMCVEGTETYAERKEKREKEIAALKEALVILDDWQK